MMKLPGSRPIIILALFVLGGCSEGEKIPLSPPSVLCERPLDPGWYPLNNICAGRSPRDVVWHEGLSPVVVGEDGLILESRGPGLWTEQFLGLSEDLRVVSANAQGDLVAAGTNGALVVRTQGQWRLETSLESTGWNDVRANGQEIWLAGDDGALAVGIPGQTWRMVDFPDTTDLLTVCAFEDSVFVGGRAGLLSVLVDNQWHNVAPSQWGQADVKSMVRLPDGRLVVWADSLLFREPSGWAAPYVEIFPAEPEGRLKYRDGYLWFPNSRYRRLELTDYSYPTSFYAENDLSEGTPGPDGQVMVLSHEGSFDWYLLQEDQTLQREADPVGPVSMLELFRLNDGTVASITQYSLMIITSNGITKAPGLSAEIETTLNYYSRIAGQSLDDFYLANNYTILHCLNGEVVWQGDVPAEGGRVDSMQLEPGGRLFVATYHTVMTWDGSQWTLEYGDLENGSSTPTFMTENGTFARQVSGALLYSSDQGLIPLDLGYNVVLAFEREQGILEFLERNQQPRYTWWEKGTGVNGTMELDPVPGCQGIVMMVGCDGPYGALVATKEHSLVLKIPENVMHGNWDLVAGPSEYEIRNLEVLPDGVLVTINRSINYLMGYRPSGY